MISSANEYWRRVADELGRHIGVPTPAGAAASGRPTVDPPDTPSGAKARRTALDREFLPSALEIVETPPAPGAVLLLWTICFLFASVILWASLSTIEIHAVATGRIQPTGRAKIVEPLEPGSVAAIHVMNGTRVKAGAILVELDGSEAQVEVRALARDHAAARAEAARRRVAIAAVSSEQIEVTEISFPDEVGSELAARERAVLDADLVGLKGRLLGLSAELSERQAQQRRLSGTIEGRRRLIAVLDELLDMRQALREKQLNSRTAVLDAQERRERERTALIGEEGMVAETEAAIVSARQRLAQLRLDFTANETLKFSEAQKLADRLSEALHKARAKAERRRLTAPIDGIVERLSVMTLGQVVGAGEEVATIIPEDGAIEVEALIADRDIGFVSEGQSAVVKIDAFPFTRYGTLEGRVVKLARASLDAGEAARRADVTGRAGAQGAGEAGGRRGGPVFVAKVAIPRNYVEIDERRVALTPGMSVSVEIRTGERRAIDYLLSPLRETLARTSRER